MLKRLRIGQKFTLTAVAFALPLVVLTYFLVLEANRGLEFTRAELEGTAYLRPLHELAFDVATHRDLAIGVSTGETSFKAELDARAEKIDDDLKAVAAVQAKHGLGAPEHLETLRADWAGLRTAAATGKPDDIAAQHRKYLSKIQQFTVLIGNVSNVILDPDVDSYYLADAVIFKVPKVTAELSDARAQGIALLGAAGPENAHRKQTLAEVVVRISDAFYQANQFMRFSANKEHPRTEEALSITISDTGKAVNGFNDLLNDRVVNGTGAAMPVRDYFAAATVPVEATEKLWEVTIAELDRLLRQRLVGLAQNRLLELVIAGAALILTLLFLFIVVRSVVRPIKHLTAVAERISLGEMDAIIQVDTRDEIGALADQFRRLQVSLKAAMDALDRHGEL